MKLLETYIEISARTASLEAGLKTSVYKSRAAVREMNGIFKSLSFPKLSFQSLIIGAGAVWGLKGSIDTVIGSVSLMAHEYEEMSKRTGLSAATLTEWSYVAKMSGTTMEGMEKGLRKLSINMLEIARGGGKSAKKTFSDLGISVLDSGGQLRDINSVLFEVSDKLKGMTNETQRVAYASQIFGARVGTVMLPALMRGSAGIRDLIQDGRNLGVVMKDDMISSAARYEEEIKRLTSAISGLKILIGTELIPMAADWVRGLTEWISKNKELISNDISGVLKTTVGALSEVWEYRGVFKEMLEIALIAAGTSALMKLGTAIYFVSTALATSGIAGIIATITKVMTPARLAWTALTIVIYDYIKALEMLKKLVPDTGPPPSAKFFELKGMIPKAKVKQGSFGVTGDFGLPSKDNPDLGGNDNEIKFPFPAWFNGKFAEKEYNDAIAKEQKWEADAKALRVAGMQDEYSEVTEFYDNLLNYKVQNSEWLRGFQIADSEREKELREQQKQSWISLGDTISNTMLSAMTASGNAFANIAESFGKMIQEMTTQIMVRSVVWGLLNMITGGTAGTFASFVFPGRAPGGPVSANQPYIVGERGPELFVPSQSGKIVSNSSMTDDHSTVNIYLPSGTDLRGLNPATFATLYKDAKRRGYLRSA